MKKLKFKGDRKLEQKKQENNANIDSHDNFSVWRVATEPSNLIGPFYIFNDSLSFSELNKSIILKEMDDIKEPTTVNEVFIGNVFQKSLFAFKSSSNIYVGCNQEGKIILDRETITENELWQLETLSEGFALKSHFGKYLNVLNGSLEATQLKIGNSAIFTVKHQMRKNNFNSSKTLQNNTKQLNARIKRKADKHCK